MAFSITGAKYAAAILSVAGTSNVTVSTAPFVWSDFTITRLVGLYSSLGVFKGMAWVRRYVATNQLELETTFFDPCTYLEVAQSIGDQILISKNFSESVVAGLAVSNNTVTITDTVTFGVAGNQLGVCFYDENKTITTTSLITISGGLTVFGKIADIKENVVVSSVDILKNAGSTNVLNVNNSAANFFGNGGSWGATYSPAYFNNALSKSCVFNKVECSVDITSSVVSVPERSVLRDCYSQTSSSNSICVRWANGTIIGGKYRILNYSNLPISIFGFDSAGTFNIKANPGERSVVYDMAQTVALVRSGISSVLNFNFTNLIAQRINSILGGANGPANPNGTNRLYFSDEYTNLKTGSVGVVLNNIGAVVDSVLSTSTKWNPSLLLKTCVGNTVSVNATSWTYGFKKYGYQAVSDSILPSTYNLGTAGSADNVAFGGLVNQLEDAGITLTQSAANALTNISTLDELYDASVDWATSSVANAQVPSLSTYPINWSGDTLDAGSFDIVVASTGATFSISGNTITINSNSLQKGVKFSKLKTLGFISLGVFSNIDFNAYITQYEPTDLLNVKVPLTLIYNINIDKTVTFTNCEMGSVVNLGTGMITINKVNSTITDYVDSEINFIDSTISVIGADTVTFHPTANDRDLNVNASGSFSGSYAFKFGSTINGSTMSGTLYLRCVAGGIPFNINKPIVLGDNLVDLGTTAQLASLSAKIDLTAKQASLEIVNEGVKKASQFKPHKTNL